MKITVPHMLIGLLALLLPVKAGAVEVVRPVAVVELFTSQGCNSCPPADRLLGELAREGKVLALSRHVDYWDYLGWKDSFAMPENTERQYGYARTLGERQVYTPQLVLNGRIHMVGSKENDVRRAIKNAHNGKNSLVVPIDVEVRTDSIAISVPEEASSHNATLYLVHFDAKGSIDIERGENAGKTITYSNVVRGGQPLGMVKAGGLSVEFPLAELRRGGHGSLALLLQKSDPGGNPAAILGAVSIHGL